jgi:hypothetical protein
LWVTDVNESADKETGDRPVAGEEQKFHNISSYITVHVRDSLLALSFSRAPASSFEPYFANP